MTQSRLPDLGPDQFVLEYKLNPKARVGIVLADPVVYDPDQPSPFVYDFAGTTWAGQQGWDGSFGLNPPNSRVTRYRQVYRASPTRSEGVPFALTPGAETESVRGLVMPPQSQQVAQWSRRLLDKLIADGKLPAAVDASRREYDPLTLSIAPQDRRLVAESFRDFLADGREFQYSLTLTRQNRLIDPIEDFLFHTKTGHCERFATALVLMLRSVGIPAQFVLGFKGCDPEDDGKYVVRQEHAHAWVEALIPADVDGRALAVADARPDAARERRIVRGRRRRVVGRRPSDRAAVLRGLHRRTDPGHPAPDLRGRPDRRGGQWSHVIAGAGLAGGLALLRFRSAAESGCCGPAAPPTDAAPWFTRLVALLAPRGLDLAPA